MSQIVSDDTPADPTAEQGGKRAGGLLGSVSRGLRRLPAWFAALTQRQKLLAAIAAVLALIVLIVAILVWYLIFRQPLSQLPGLNVAIPPNYSYSISDVQKPIGVAVDDANGRVYVTQSDGDRKVKVFAIDGTPLGELQPPEDGFSHVSTYVAVDPTTQRVYVTDRGSNSLYVYGSDGEYVDVLRPADEKVWGPLGITISKDGVIYVANANSNPMRIIAMKADGTVLRVIGAAEGLSYPNGLAILDDGGLAVADSNHARVLIYNADGTLRGQLAQGEADAAMGMPRGLAVGAKGVLYIVDTTNSIVRMYKAGANDVPEYSTMFGQLGDLDGQFVFPNGIATDSHGHIFVTDRENNRLQVWTNP